jgi:ADP-L-glycero-D-manno-heptose 6-epimerase
MKILVTGYKGFIAQNFLKDPEVKKHEISLYEWGEPNPKIEGLDWVIHFGANSETTCSELEAEVQNRRSTVELFEECKRFGVNFQYSSSASVYGNKNRTFRETDEVDPQSFYAQSKVDIEKHILGNPGNIISQGFRYFNVHGPHETHKGSMASPYHQFMKQAMNDGVIKIFEGSDEFKRDFVPVKYVVDIHKAFLNIKTSGVWNIGTGNPKSFLEVAWGIAKQTGATIEEIPFPKGLKEQYQEYTCADTNYLNLTLEKLKG